MSKKVVNFADLMTDDEKFQSTCRSAIQFIMTTKTKVHNAMLAFDSLRHMIDHSKFKQAKPHLLQLCENLCQIQDDCLAHRVQLGHLRGWDSTTTMEIFARTTEKIDALNKQGEEYDFHEIWQEAEHEVEAKQEL